MTILKASNITKSYGNFKALKDFSLEIESGDIVALLGPNGAGKTTFVKSILGLLQIDSGEIELFGKSSKDVSARDKLVYLPEKFSFYSYFTVIDTLKFYASMYNKENDQVDYNHYLKLLSIEELSTILLGSHFSNTKVHASARSSTCKNSLKGFPLPQHITEFISLSLASWNFLIREGITWLFVGW